MPIVFKGRVFSVEVDRRRFPNGQEHEVAIVRHSPSVVIIPMRDDGQVILIRQYRASVDRELWEVPAGRVDVGETPEEAVVRECEEEIGLVPRTLQRIRGLYPGAGLLRRGTDFLPSLRSRSAARPIRRAGRTRTRTSRSSPAPSPRRRRWSSSGQIVDLKTAYALTLI